MNNDVSKKRLGSEGEDLAAGYLTAQGYKILARNYRVASGEIDIIAKDKKTVCFIEVKTRKSYARGSPFEAINYWKQRKYSQLAQYYLAKEKLIDVPARFDVVAVTMDHEGSAKIELLKNAFDAIGV